MGEIGAAKSIQSASFFLINSFIKRSTIIGRQDKKFGYNDAQTAHS